MTKSASTKKFNPVEVIAGTLAAVSAAVAASFLGVNGTVTGAAVGSVIATVSTAFYSHSLARSRERLAPRLRWVTRPGSTGDPPATRTTNPARGTTGTVYGSRRRRPWRLVAVSAVAVFGLAIGAITATEYAIGQPLASLFGGHATGTTISNLDGGSTPVTNTTPVPTATEPSDAGSVTSSPEPTTSVPPVQPSTGSDGASTAPTTAATAPTQQPTTAP
jgi:hypothetical protein